MPHHRVGRDFIGANIAQFRDYMNGSEELGTDEYAVRANEWIKQHPTAGPMANVLLRGEKERHEYRKLLRQIEAEDAYQAAILAEKPNALSGG